MPTPRIHLTRPDAPSREVTLHEAYTVVGRDPHLELCLNDPEVSRRHALFARDGQTTTIRDLNSRNGVFLNGERLPNCGSALLRHGDQVMIGWTTFSYWERPSQRIDAAGSHRLRITREPEKRCGDQFHGDRAVHGMLNAARRGGVR